MDTRDLKVRQLPREFIHVILPGIVAGYRVLDCQHIVTAINSAGTRVTSDLNRKQRRHAH